MNTERSIGAAAEVHQESVSSCNYCWLNECGSFCDHPRLPDALSYEQRRFDPNMPPPDWCPLREGPLLVELSLENA